MKSLLDLNEAKQRLRELARRAAEARKEWEIREIDVEAIKVALDATENVDQAFRLLDEVYFGQKHTPGPWKLEIDEDEGIIRLKMGTALEDAPSFETQHLIELRIDPHARKSWNEAVANMRLMRAAPDLLWAAKVTLSYLEKASCVQCFDGSVSVSVGEYVAILRSAIAKACESDDESTEVRR